MMQTFYMKPIAYFVKQICIDLEDYYRSSDYKAMIAQQKATARLAEEQAVKVLP